MMRTGIIVAAAVSVVGCYVVDGEPCLCTSKDDCAAWCEAAAQDDEAGTADGCGRVVDNLGTLYPLGSACDEALLNSLANQGRVVQSYDETLESCGAQQAFDCMTGPAYPSFGEPNKCYYCPDWDTRLNGVVVGNVNQPVAYAICVQSSSEWVPAELLGAIAPLDGDPANPRCDLIPPPLGSVVLYTEVLWCFDGVSCLDGGARCSCKCRDPQSGEEYRWLNDYFADQEPLDYFEPTCTGEPLAGVKHPVYGTWWDGTTLELDGPEPAYPPNGAYEHTPLWDLLAASVKCSATTGQPSSTVCTVDASFVATALAQPNELLGGVGYELVMASDGTLQIDITACETPSICSAVGLAEGDRLIGADGQPLTLSSASAAVLGIAEGRATPIAVLRASGAATRVIVDVEG